MRTPLTSRPRFRVAAACVVAAVAVLPSALLAWRAPTTLEVPAAEADVRHELDVSVYGIADRPSSLYPEGRSQAITPGEDGGVPEDAPALLRGQIDELRVTVAHEVIGAEDVSGAGRVDVVLRTGRGFELGLNGVPMTQFTNAFGAEVTLALDAIDERFATYLEEAELDSDSMVIEVRPLVATEDGVTVRGGPVVIDPTGQEITVSGLLRTITTAEGETTTAAATVPLLGVPLAVPVARALGTAVVVLLLLVAAALLRRELRQRPDLRIGLLHGSLLVDIESDANVGGEIVRVTSIAELTRLARRDERTILHQERTDGRHHYLVPDGELTYEYVVDGAGDQAAGIGLPVPGDAASLLDYLPVTAADLPPGRVVMVEDFTELTRIWMRDNAAPGRLQRRRLAHGGIRYSVVRNGREFVYDASPEEDVAALAAERDPSR